MKTKHVKPILIAFLIIIGIKFLTQLYQGDLKLSLGYFAILLLLIFAYLKPHILLTPLSKYIHEETDDSLSSIIFPILSLMVILLMFFVLS